jgi:hypothetical protein
MRFVTAQELVKDYIIGVDLGQAQDFTALCVLEQEQRDTGERVPDWPAMIIGGVPAASRETLPVYENLYAVRHLERLPIGTPYPEQVAKVKDLVGHLQPQARVSLVVDQTGVGRPVLDMLKRAKLSPYAVTITGGDSVTHEGREYRVPKRDLMSTVQVLLQSKRLTIASSLKEAQTLISELLAFKATIALKSENGDDVSPWREGVHDDLVLAVALAAWYGENGMTRRSLVWGDD